MAAPLITIAGHPCGHRVKMSVGFHSNTLGGTSRLQGTPAAYFGRHNEDTTRLPLWAP
jgi:hypothetical protein